MKKIFIFLILVFFLFLSAGYLWWSLSKPQIPQGIILISLDTLRADHLGAYGYHRDTSPSIDVLAKESVVFENAVVQSPWTLPSHMSIMTSLYPSFHGLTDKDTFLPLSDEYVTLAELLQKGGFKTGAFTDGGFVSAKFGFGRGFDTYYDQGGGIKTILPEAKKWLGLLKSEPFFLFIHCYDIHSPYNPPPPYNTMFHDLPYTGNVIPSNKMLTNLLNNKVDINSDDVNHIIAFYDGGIRYTDAIIGEFLSYLKSIDLYNQSLIIVTSDHGEEFYEHGSILHWQLYFKPDLHVPLIMHIPGFSKRKIRINELVRSIDLLPTIVDIAGLPKHDQAQGRSLLPLIRKKESLLTRVLLNISDLFKKEDTISFAETKYYKHRKLENPFKSIIANDGYHMVYDQISDSIKLFNLTLDPDGKNNIAKDHSDVTQRLLSQWEKFFSAKKETSQRSQIVSLDKQTLKQLEALGYVDHEKYIPGDRMGTGNKDDVNSEYDSTEGVGRTPDNTSAEDVKTVNTSVQKKDVDEDQIPDYLDECIDTDWDGYGTPGFLNSCDEDNCPFIFNPQQEDKNGNGIGDLCENYVENPDKEDIDLDSTAAVHYWLEAERAFFVVPPFQIAIDEDASGEKYIFSPEGSGDHYKPGLIMVTYTVKIAQADDYVLWGRVIAASEEDDTFFVQIDDGFYNTWNIEIGNSWHWDVVNNRGRIDPVIFSLKKGTHTVKIVLREDGVKLDKMLLTNDLDFVPSGKKGIVEN
jgi:arylsulfatase A-like enzyme